MHKENTSSGIEIIGDLSWGTHFCSFFDTKKDFLDILLPYFKAGLENNEYCLWIITPPLTEREAEQALAQHVPNLNEYIEKQSIEIIPHTSWFLEGKDFNLEKVKERWDKKLNKALKLGFKGMRVNGGGGWFQEDKVLNAFMDFEKELNQVILDKPVIVLCSYPLEKCSGTMVLDVAQEHEMVLSKRNERWETLEVPAIRKSKAQLISLNERLERKVAERARKLEKAVGKLKEEIANRKKNEEELANIANDLIQRSTDLQQFAYIVSHNLRAPVANILGLSDILKGETANADKRKIQDYLFNSVANLDEIVKDLNKVLETKFEFTERSKKIHLTELVDNIKSSLQNLLEKEQAQILADFSEIDEIKTIKSYLHSIFYNLIQNSIKYKHPGRPPVIQIKSALHDGKVRISFKDNGIGIDLKKYSDKIFGLYQRFHSDIEGKGIGLFMVKTQVEVLEGRISLKSKPQVGTEITIELPVRA